MMTMTKILNLRQDFYSLLLSAKETNAIVHSNTCNSVRESTCQNLKYICED